MKNTNIDRRRYYGLRIGDIVQINIRTTSEPMMKKAEVIDFGVLDNNGVRLRFEDGTETNWVAEWCDIIEKVENRDISK